MNKENSIERLATHDRNPISMLKRQESIDDWIMKIDAEGKDGLLVIPEESVVLVKYSEKNISKDRLGMIVYRNDSNDNNVNMEFIITDYGLEGVRDAHVKFNNGGIAGIEKSGYFGEIPDNNKLSGLPKIILDMLPKITGYSAPFGGMFKSDSDFNPLVKKE